MQLGLGVLLLMLSAALAWQVQGWRYGRLLAQLAQAQAAAEAARLLAERGQRRALEQRLEQSETRHYKELSDAQQSQARLRDRLATADLRLSVLVERETVCNAVPAAASAGSVDHATVRAGLEPAHARRIIAITDEGDRGLIALRACQDYVREVRGMHPGCTPD
ncbi:lysis system i-spanin subunit Rz [Pseudomonas sp. MN1F]|uniref:lysis system i-spanin subunit Rz n=1 Tax=Pseudomonas sp. MN1F TaxID=1366632 RepID=UPI00128F8A74|nr:lysis system i-spanin subunit Rz [Pseudomonas sp. MN1F]MQG93428.1 lysis protein [Pseudomonas sp. MN1F]